MKINWSTFIVALGLLIIVLSPNTDYVYASLTTGIFIFLFGLYLLKRNSNSKKK